MLPLKLLPTTNNALSHMQQHVGYDHGILNASMELNASMDKREKEASDQTEAKKKDACIVCTQSIIEYLSVKLEVHERIV